MPSNWIRHSFAVSTIAFVALLSHWMGRKALLSVATLSYVWQKSVSPQAPLIALYFVNKI